MEKAAELDKKLIIAVGNAPTALVRLYELIGEGKIKPALIIGVPVGFVNVVQSKELIMQTNIPFYSVRNSGMYSNRTEPACASHLPAAFCPRFCTSTCSLPSLFPCSIV